MTIQIVKRIDQLMRLQRELAVTAINGPGHMDAILVAMEEASTFGGFQGNRI